MGQWPRRLATPTLATLLAGALGLAGGGASAGVVSPAAPPTSRAATASYLVQARDGSPAAAAQAIRTAGGTVARSLPIMGGVAARLPATAARRLSLDPAIARVQPDRSIRFSSGSFAAGTSSNYPRATGATSVWDNGKQGAGVTVAVIDTGIAPVADLTGRVIAGPDFSGENSSTVDSYGHGTVIAGVIAGDGAASASQSGGAFAGMAPEAKVLSVKVAGRNGATDVSTVLAAMQWVGSHRAQYNIGVVELAWGTPSDQSPAIDPLNFAVERLWHAGIVVVAAAGNDGPLDGTVTKPGDDPLIITAGAYNDQQTSALSDDAVTAWSSRGPTAAGFAKPDLVAPGRLIVAPKSPGSTIDLTYPEASVGTDYIRGSGTSQASAVVAGGVALLLTDRAWMTPDQVKYALTTAAVPIAAPATAAEGAGRLSLPGAISTRVRSVVPQTFAGTGTGSLEDSRGGRHVDTTCPGMTDPTTVIGEMDALCLPWESTAWAMGAWTPESWTSSSWSSSSWSSSSWSSSSWSSSSWSSSEFLTAFWGKRTPWWKPLPGEPASPRPVRVNPRQMTP